MPLGAVAACLLFAPGVVLWAIFAIRTKDNTAAFFNAVAPVSSSTLDAATSAVLTTLVTLVAGCSLIFLAALVLACARHRQARGGGGGRGGGGCCPCGESAKQCVGDSGTGLDSNGWREARAHTIY